MESPWPLYRQIFNSIMKFGITRFLFTGLTMLSTLFIIRILGPLEYGRLSLVLHVALMGGLLVSFGFSGTLAKFIPSETRHETKAALASQAMGICAVAFLVALIVFLAIRFGLPQWIPMEIRFVGPAFILFVFGISLFNVMQGIFRGAGLFVKWTFFEGLQDATGKILAMGSVLVLGRQFNIAFYPMVLSMAGFVAWGFWSLRDYWRWSPLGLRADVARYSLIVLLGQVTFIAAVSMDPLLLRVLLKDTAEVGYYFAGIRIPKLLESFLVAPLSVPFIYYFSHPDSQHTAQKIVTQGTRFLGIIMGFLSAVLLAVAEPLVSNLFGPYYLKSIPVLQIYSFILFFVGMQSTISSYFFSINKPGIPIAIGFTGSIVLAVLDWLLIPHWRASGAAAATIIWLFLMTVLFIIFVPNRSPLLVSNFFKLTLALACSVGVGYAGTYFLAPPVFIVLVVVSGLYSRDDWERIKKLFNRAAI